MSKLTSLVRAGLFDAKKINIVKRALEKNPAEMTLAERKILIELLESLMSEVLHSQQVYSKVKQNVMSGKEKMNEAVKDSYLTKFDPRMTKYPSESDIPAVLILKRKAIRIYPDNQKVALYYAQAIDKYVSIPYGNINTSMNETKGIQHVPINTLFGDPDKEQKAKEYIDKSAVDPFFKAGLKTSLWARKKVGPSVETARTSIKKKVGELTKKSKISVGNLNKGFKADRAVGSEKTRLNPRDYNNRMISPMSSPMHRFGKTVSGFGKKTGMYEESDKVEINEVLPLIGLGIAAAGRAAIGAGARMLAKRAAKKAAEKASKPKPTTRPKPTRKSKSGNVNINTNDDSNDNSNTPAPSAPEKTFTQPKKAFGKNIQIKVNDPTQNKFDTEVARNRKRESQYDKSLTTSESVISQLYTIKESHNEGFINIDNNNVAINKIVAEKVINVFESLNEENQKKVSTMLNESVDSFKKIINFAVRQ